MHGTLGQVVVKDGKKEKQDTHALNSRSTQRQMSVARENRR